MRVVAAGAFCLLAVTLGSGCVQKPLRPPFAVSALEAQYEKGFATFKPPALANLRSTGHPIRVHARTVADVWDATILVTMQRAPVVVADPVTRVVVAPPYAVAVDEDEAGVVVYVDFLDDLYKWADGSGRAFVDITPDDRQRFVDDLGYQIATQVEATDKLRPTGSWAYLMEDRRMGRGQ